jgi:hypothetical protein
MHNTDLHAFPATGGSVGTLSQPRRHAYIISSNMS